MITYTFIKHLIKLIRWLFYIEYSIIKFIILSIIKIFIILTTLITI